MSSSSAEGAAGGAPAGADGSATRVALLGSGGSIGRQAVDVLLALGDAVPRDRARHRVAARAPRGAGGRPPAGRGRHLGRGAPSPRRTCRRGPQRIGGPDALVELATRDDVDLVVVATGGVVSLRPVLAALAAGKVVATANKEVLVAAGHLVMPVARERAAEVARRDPTSPMASPLGWLRPIDSEHSAIWQCLAGEGNQGIERIVLTASGGPFRGMDAARLARVTPEEALRHPTWSMGAKITIDSATLANKGLEVIEAHWLYDVGYDAIDVVVHPQSVVHSAVLFRDGSLKAQLGTPDMRIPIQYALTYPRRLPSPARHPDLVATGSLTFEAPDETRFPALRIARDAGRGGPWTSAALISADEVAVPRFLEGSLTFTGIARLLEAAVDRAAASTPSAPPSVDDLVALDAEVRAAFATGAWTEPAGSPA